MTVAKSYKIDEAAAGLLDRLGSRGQGQYVSRTVLERWQAWQEAVEILEQQGWTWPVLAAACDALNGYFRARPVGAFLAAELHDAQHLHDLCSLHDIEPALWEQLTTQVSRSADIAWALDVCVREFWADNPVFEARAQRLGAG